MKRNVESADTVVAIISDGQGVQGNAYFERTYCLQELRWAIGAETYIQPVVSMLDKCRISDFMDMAPDDLKLLGQTEFVDLNWSDPAYWEVGIEKLLKQTSDAVKEKTEQNTYRSSGGSII